MAQPTTEDGSRPPIGSAAWAHPFPIPSGQQRADFSAVSAPAAQPQHLLADAHRQQQLHHPHLVHHQQPNLQQPQQQFTLYDPQYYTPPLEPYTSIPFTQAPVERHSYYQPHLGQLPGAAVQGFDVAPSLGQPQHPATYNQSFSPEDSPVFAKKEPSSLSPPRQQKPATPPHSAVSTKRTHRQRASIDLTSAMSAQVEIATPLTMAIKTSKSGSATPSRKAVPSPKAGKKRSRQDADGEDDGSADQDEHQKKRGRPRLSGGGESRAERRREQIRDAQRAYRNRKDNRIVELEEQVERLEREKIDMSRDLGSVFELLRNQGSAQPSAAIARRFDELMQKYPMVSYEGDAQSILSENTVRDRLGQPGPPQQTLGTISSASSDHQATMHAAQARPQMQGPHLSFGSSNVGFYPPDNLSYEVITQPTPENASFPSYAPDPRAPGGWIEQPPVPPHPQQAFFQQVGAEQALVHNPMPNPDSSAANEATFGRRLQRRTLERGLRLALMKNPPPDRFGAVFGFCLLVESRDQIINRLSSCLHSLKEESLNYWRFPFHNLGGSGFPSERATSNSPNEVRIGNQGFVESYKPQDMTGFAGIRR